MADTAYTDNVTVITADTMNDLNRLHYTIFSDPADGAAAGKTLITGLTEDTAPDHTADFVMTYDASAATAKKTKLKTISGTATQTLTDAATVNWDVSAGGVATLTLGGNRTMAAPTNLAVGTYILHVLQDGTGSRTITWNAVFKWQSAVAPTLTTTANRRDVFCFICDGTNLYGSAMLDVR